MSDSEETVYSTMFSSLKHPARRKILRMISENPMTFSQMLETLGVSSSHLTYHLESLGELLFKDENGKYRLSTFGEASVNTMRIVEEAPAIQPKHRLNLPFKWKSALALLLVATALLASFSYVQYSSLSQLSSEHKLLESKYDQLLSWSAGANNAIAFLHDVAQIDVEKYQATLLSDTVEQRADLGGTVEQILRYSLTNSDGKLDVVFRFRNGRLSMYQMVLLEGSPVYAKPQPYRVLDAAKALLERFKSFDSADYLEEMSRMTASVNETGSFELTVGNTKLLSTVSEDGSGKILWMYTENGVDFSPKSLELVYNGGVLTQLTDGWFLFAVANTDVNISSERAVEIARNYLKTYTWTAEGVTVSDFTVLAEPASVVFHPSHREEPLTLVPYWFVTFYLDKVYPGGVNRLGVGVWADTGEIGTVKKLSG